MRPLIALLAGARASDSAARWLAGMGCEGVAIWAPGSVPIALDLPLAKDVPRDAAGVLDVTHAFDTQTCRAALARASRASYAHLARALWAAQTGDRWTEVDTLGQALDALPRGARVFAATGRASLPVLGAHDGQVFLRQLTRHGDPTGHANCHFVFGAAPFDPEGEARLLRDLRIDVVLARNIGGTGSFPKLAAARALGLPVVLVRPPPRPAGAILCTAADVAEWVAGL